MLQGGLGLARTATAIGVLLAVGACGTLPRAESERFPAAPRIAAFEPDGCSCFPDGSWGHHCDEHDFAYWMGGTRSERLDADRLLRDRLRADDKPVIGCIMFLGVRLGGSPWLPTPWRWGFGWPYPRGYRELTPDEIAAVRDSVGEKPRPVATYPSDDDN